MTRVLGDVVARGTRSVVHAYGRGAVVKVPKPATPDNWMAEDWIDCEARYAEAARAAGAPAARLLGIESIDGRPASVWERIEGATLWQQVLDRPERSVEVGRRLAELQLALFELVAPVALPSQHDRLVSKIRMAAARVDAGLARALDLIPERVGRLRLCHGDLHPSNVILSREGPVIVDWYDASRGDADRRRRAHVPDAARRRRRRAAPPARVRRRGARRADRGVPRAAVGAARPRPTSGWSGGRGSTPSRAWPRAWRLARCSRSGSAARHGRRAGRRPERPPGARRTTPAPATRTRSPFSGHGSSTSAPASAAISAPAARSHSSVSRW